MTALEEKIINAIREMPDDEYGDYRSIDALMITIAKSMGYEYRMFLCGKTFRNEKECRQYHNTLKIVKGMQDRGIITVSKSGYMFKLNI